MKDKQQESQYVTVTPSDAKKPQRRISVTIEQLTELANNGELLKEFRKALEENPEMHAPIALMFAKAQLKQLKMEV